MRRITLLSSALLLMLFSFRVSYAQFPQRSSTQNIYIQRDDQPNAAIFLPAPPDTCDVAYLDDFVQWQWGKSMRLTERGERASDESASSTTEMARIYSQALGFNISRSETPAIYNLMSRSYHTAEQASKNPKEKYMRIRPVIQYNELPSGKSDRLESLRTSGSYPSGHTTRGMAVALVLAEMAPDCQDSILRRGFEYGESRIIVSAHYQSDVNAGYLCASACVAAMHSIPAFADDMEAARKEYYEKTGRKPETGVGYPDARRILNQPVDTASNRYMGDVMQYMAGKGERKTERGQQALKDADLSADAIMAGFSESIGLKLDSRQTPAMAALVSECVKALGKSAQDAAAGFKFRKRPYGQLGDAPFAGADDSKTSSFPSIQAETGWGVALVLTEIAPAKANDILTVGYRMGQSGIISGQNWATDIPAARILASGLVANLHTDAKFSKLLQEAKEEYQSKAK